MYRAPVSTSNGGRLECRQRARAITLLLMHLDRDGVAGFYGTSPSHGTPVVVAPDAVGRNVRQRVVVLRHPDACFSLIDAIDPEVLESGVCCDVRYRQRCHESNND